MSRIDGVVPKFVNAETVFQKVLSDKNSNSYEIRTAEQDFDKAVSEITSKRENYSIIISHYSRRGVVHA